MIKDEQIERSLDYVWDNAALIGQLRGQKVYLEHRIKIERSERYLDAEGTVSEREAIAWTDPSVHRLCDDYRDCITEMHTTETYFKAAELRIAVYQTQSANQRRGNI